MRIAHIINPVNAPASSDLYVAQPVTFVSLKKAAAEASVSGIRVALLAACFVEDLPAGPEGFKAFAPLSRSVRDISTDLPEKPKLPLLKDILELLYASSSGCDVLIYTNVDIAVQPHFYSAVKKFVDDGWDSFTINKRIISSKYDSSDRLEEMSREKGKPHLGSDCFVFRRKLFPRLDVGDVCVGKRMFDKALLWNLMAFGKPFRVFRDDFLTFHIGDKKNWASDSDLSNDLFFMHNRAALKKVVGHIEKNAGSVFNDPLLYEQMMIPVSKDKRICDMLDLKEPFLSCKLRRIRNRMAMKLALRTRLKKLWRKK